MPQKITRSVLARAKAAFDAAKHPRGAKGRFTETPDAPKKGKISKKQLDAAKGSLVAALEKTKLPLTKDRLDQAAKGLTKAANGRVRQSDLERAAKGLAGLTPKQKEAALERSLVPTKGIGILPQHRHLTKRESITVKDGRVEIWQGAKQAQADPSFKVRTDKGFEYKAGDTVLNRNTNVFVFQGETVKGVPSLHPHLRDMKDEDLAKSLLSTMSMTEKAPRAPIWNPGVHGQVQGIWTYRGEDKKDYYGEMQIHHIGQWSRVDPGRQRADLEAGKTDLDQIKAETAKATYKETYLDPKKGQIDRIALRVQDQAAREFVILPGGLHDFNSSLFQQVHPKFFHPETGKQVHLGIPHKGKDAASGSREWFDKWRPKFWQEVYRRESYVLRQELQRRLDKGLITPSDLEKTLDKAYQSAIIEGNRG